jgi:hypothetical protein
MSMMETVGVLAHHIYYRNVHWNGSNVRKARDGALQRHQATKETLADLMVLAVQGPLVSLVPVAPTVLVVDRVEQRVLADHQTMPDHFHMPGRELVHEAQMLDFAVAVSCAGLVVGADDALVG